MTHHLIPEPWSKDCQEVLKELGVSKDTGLSSIGVRKLISVFGKNVLLTEKKVSKLQIFFKQLNNHMVYLLFSALVVALILGEVLDASAILSILILNSVIGYFQESRASEAIEALKKLSVPTARVLRDQQVKSIPSEDVVPGDILIFEAGDYVSADARLLEAFQLSVDEALLSGESLPISKSIESLSQDTFFAERKNMIHAGSAISNGTGKAIVTATGMQTEIGRIAELLEDSDEKMTPLQVRLNIVSNRLIMMGAVVIFIVFVLRFLEHEPWYVILMSAISLAVAAIPEGLPTVVTLALTLAVRRMTKRNAIIRNLSAVETLGSTDVICTDKTGTLTTGIMTVREIFLLDENKRDSFLRAMVLCNNASLDNGGSGDPTEKALLEYANNYADDLDHIRQNFPRLHEWSFESDRKRMSVAVQSKDGVHIFTKGAPEVMIDLCLLDEEDKERIRRETHRLTSKGQRLLAAAQKKDEVKQSAFEIERDLEFLGLVAMADPPKNETIAAIKNCQEAGIKVVMITGDHPVTAKAIALELGIAIPGSFDEVLTGKEIEELKIDGLRGRAQRTAVYARVSPFHKLKIVEALQGLGHVVAMTGDGVNDAPALKKAQIGVAMGKAGTEVARQASSMILTDDNFSTIVSAVEEGRAIFGNIKRTIQYLLSTNLAEILIVLGASIFSLPVPFTPIGLLWINLVTDGFPSLALAAEPLDKNLLSDSKRPSPNSFFDRYFLTELFFVGLMMTLISLGTYAYMLKVSTEEKARTYTFSILVFMALFRSFSCRSETKSFFQLKLNYYHLLSVLFPMILQICVDQTQFYQRLFKVQELSLMENLHIILASMLPFLILELIKYRKSSRIFY
jgi:Ca2+-transporting ATPase